MKLDSYKISLRNNPLDLQRMLNEAPEDVEALILTYRNKNFLFLRETFIQSFSPSDRVIVNGQPLSEAWGTRWHSFKHGILEFGVEHPTSIYNWHGQECSGSINYSPQRIAEEYQTARNYKSLLHANVTYIR